MRNLLFVPAVLVLAACGAASQKPAPSSLEYAHFPPQSAFGGPLGRLEVLKLGFEADYAKIKVCVETEKKKIADDEVVLEARLAYASWLAGVGSYAETDWQLFEFDAQKKCNEDDKAYGAFVVLAEFDQIGAGEDTASKFQEQRIQCEQSGGFKSCSGNGITLGWGGPGSLTYWYQGNQQKWTKLANYLPSSTTLSPYIDWISLKEDLNRKKPAQLAAATKQALMAKYDVLKGKGAEATMAELAAFVAELAANSLTATNDPVFSQLAQGFYASSATTLDKTYRGERGSFATLLHEVGHQFGMDHAHHPDQDSITGQTEEATQQSNGQWTTDIASMAYGLPYLFLTADDHAGVKSDQEHVRAYLQSHK